MWDLIVPVPDHCLSFYFVLFVFSLLLYNITNSDILSSRSHQCHDWHRIKTNPVIN